MVTRNGVESLKPVSREEWDGLVTQRWRELLEQHSEEAKNVVMQAALEKRTVDTPWFRYWGAPDTQATKAKATCGEMK